LQELHRIPSILRSLDVDLVHFPHYVVPWGIRPPLIATVHDIIQLYYPPERRTTLALWYLKTMMSSALHRARRILTVSRSSRRDLIRVFKADRKKIRVIPNGVDLELEKRPAAEKLDALKERYSLRPPLLLVVGNDKIHKNLNGALRAFHLAVRKYDIPGQLVFVGGIGEDSALARKARNLGLDTRVRFLGRVSSEELHGLYHLSAILLHIALYEGFGLPILEAMLAGLPVITSRVGAMIELGEGIARLVNPLDVQETARTISNLLVDDPLRRRMITAGRNFARTLGWDRCVNDTVSAYKEAVSGRRINQGGEK